MAGRCAEMEATVRRRGEVTAVAAFAVEANEPAAAGALVYQVPDVGVDHAFKVGGASCAPPDPMITLASIGARRRPALLNSATACTRRKGTISGRRHLRF